MNNRTNLIPASSAGNPTNSDNSSMSCREADMLEPVIRLFLQEQQVMQSSRKSYGWSLRRFFKWCGESGRQMSLLQRADIVAYVASLAEQGFSPKSIAS